MALVPCNECNHQVATTAVNCPSCGAPVAGAAEAQAAGTPLNTTQLTSKKLKTHQVLALLLFAGGVLFMIGSRSPTGEATAASVWATFAGLGWYITTRLRTWWHHG